jgi:hypothetical protein
MLALDIALGIWMGFVFVSATVWSVLQVKEFFERHKRVGSHARWDWR